MDGEKRYEVTSNYGSCIFQSKEDAVSALWLLALYHGYDLRREDVIGELGRVGYYGIFPLSIKEGRA